MHLVGDVLKVIRRWRKLEEAPVGIVLKVINYSSTLIFVHIFKGSQGISYNPIMLLHSSSSGWHNYYYFFCKEHFVSLLSFTKTHVLEYAKGFHMSGFVFWINKFMFGDLRACLDILLCCNYSFMLYPGDRRNNFCFFFFFPAAQSEAQFFGYTISIFWLQICRNWTELSNCKSWREDETDEIPK